MSKFAFLLSFLILTSFSDAQDTLNRLDENGKKQGYWIYSGKDRPELGIPANGKVEEGNYINDRKEGIWIKYQDDGKTPKIKATYKNNRPVGTYYRYQDSIWTEHKFAENTNLVRGMGAHDRSDYQATYNSNGKEEGRVNYFYLNGQLEFTYFAKDGIPVDTAYRYYQNGDLKEKVVYDSLGTILKSFEFEMINPEPPSTKTTYPFPETPDSPNTRNVHFKSDGYNKVYNTDNEILLDGLFKNGQLLDGKYYVYDSDGILLLVRIYQNGVYHSDGQL